MSKSASNNSSSSQSDKGSDKIAPVAQSSLKPFRRRNRLDPMHDARVKLASTLRHSSSPSSMSTDTLPSLAPPMMVAPFVFSAKSSSNKGKQTTRKTKGALARKRQHKSRKRRAMRKNKFKNEKKANRKSRREKAQERSKRKRAKVLNTRRYSRR